MIKVITSREFNQDVSKIKRETQNGPVFITDRGRPAHVLLSIHDYEMLTTKKESMVDLLAMPESAEVDFEPGKLNQTLFKPEKFD